MKARARSGQETGGGGLAWGWLAVLVLLLTVNVLKGLELCRSRRPLAKGSYEPPVIEDFEAEALRQVNAVRRRG